MFKHLLIVIILLLLIILISYYIIKKLVLSFHKLILSKFIIKYNLIDLDEQFLNLYSEEREIGGIQNIPDQIIFYTDIPWSTKNNNYIFDVDNNRYYIIDRGYYYYIDYSEKYKIVINSPYGKVKMMVINNNNKVSFLENNNIGTE